MEELYVLTRNYIRGGIWTIKGVVVREASTKAEFKDLTIKELKKLCKENKWKLEKAKDVEWGR